MRSSFLSNLIRWKYTLIVLIVGIPITASFLLSAHDATSTPFLVENIADKLCDARRALDAAWSRSIYYEQLVLAIGSLELAILAYIAGVILTKDTSLAKDTSSAKDPSLASGHPDIRSRMFYVLAIMLLAVTTGAYLHSWKIYMAYGAYITKMEALCFSDPEFRTVTQVVLMAKEPNLSSEAWGLGFVAKATHSMWLVTFYPVFLMAAAVVGFGRRLKISTDVIAALVIMIFIFVTLYAAPDLFEFFRCVEAGAR